uniref:Uncharacterized protein n=1 Tax=viral metagenome TaxID=1070528 RepID=A0A6M3L8Y0_9ZZZZ
MTRPRHRLGAGPNGRMFDADWAYENNLIDLKERDEAIKRMEGFPEVILPAKATSVKGCGRIIYVYVVEKWRGVANCGTHGLPSKISVADGVRTVMFNTGSYDSNYTNPDGRTGFITKFNPNKGTFAGKRIVLAFQQIDNG